jgi:hypothetical protein
MARYHELIGRPHGPGSGAERFASRIDLLKKIEEETGRPVIVYAANFNQQNIRNSIDHTDITPFSELTRTLPGRAVDIFLHSPGGLAEAAERIVALLRARFDSIRFVVLHSAFSAATMLAMSGDMLVLDDTSALGPIDPQIVYRDPQTGQSIAVPTQAVLDGFRKAKEAIKNDPDALGVYIPLLNKLDLHLFEICRNADKLSKSLVRQWLRSYMFKADPRGSEKAARVTKYLSSHQDRLSHGRPITIDILKNKLKLQVFDLRESPTLRDLYAELWAEVEWFVENSDTAKFFENAYGVAFRRRFQIQQQINLQLPLIPAPPPEEPPKQETAKP